jgi:hypothetical protein
LMLERARPLTVLGPVLFFALRRFAVRCFWVVMIVPLVNADAGS